MEGKGKGGLNTYLVARLVAGEDEEKVSEIVFAAAQCQSRGVVPQAGLHLDPICRVF